MTVKEYKSYFDDALHHECAQRIDEFATECQEDLLLKFIKHAVAITENGGKRLRPYLLNLMYRTCGGTTLATTISAEIAVELFHAALLIHDDVMDRGTKRHHLPTVHTFVTEALKSETRLVHDGVHVGYGQAISIGDLFLSWAADLLYQTNNRNAWKAWQKSFTQVIAGQLYDIDGTTRLKVDSDFISQKSNLKTISYSITGPLTIGAVLAQPKQNYSDFIDAVSQAVGMAFQLQDDLFSWVSSEDTSKNHFHDHQARQHTLIRNYIVEHASAKDIQMLDKLETTQNPNLKELCHLAESTGARSYAEHEITRLYQEAEALVRAQSFAPDITSEWLQLIRLMRHRSH